MGNHTSCEGEVAVGPWGSPFSEQNWSYKAKHGITQIIIIHGDFINSIMFKDDSTGDYSRMFGGDGGTRTDKVDIKFPSEVLTGISGTMSGLNCVSSLKLYTSDTEYGPFGTEIGEPFSFRTKGTITGFHGRPTSHLSSIGVYVKPSCSIFATITKKEQSEIDLRRMAGLLPRSPGPWGSINGGRVWDDGVFSAVKQIQVHVRRFTGGVAVITAVRFQYQKRDGADFWSEKHGTDAGDEDEVQQLKIDGVSKFLIGVEGFYGPVEGNGDVDVIRSVTFHTNEESWGPFGSEIGRHFSSMSFVDSSKGKVVGFHGRSGAHLNAIGVHREYYILSS